jgi:hypothetical protein
MNATIPVEHPAAKQTQNRHFVRVGFVSGLVASAATLVIAAVARQADVTLEVEGEPVPLLGIVQATFVAALIGTGLAAAFTRWARRPRRAFITTTVTLTALSLVPPMLVSADTATKLVLEMTHVVGALIVIPAIATRLAD